MRQETRAVVERYQRRTAVYDPLEPWIFMSRQERERALIRWLRTCAPGPPARMRLMEIGCGQGGNLLQFLRLGFHPSNLVGNELQAERASEAVGMLPAKVTIHQGDALDLQPELGPFDVVFQSLVFSSILEDQFQDALAAKMWTLARPGGGVLWYDFIYNNPSNSDVRGVRYRRIRQLFPEAKPRSWRVMLAPPVSRLVTRVHPGLYQLFNALPWLRTHMLIWLPKDRIRSNAAGAL